MFVVTASASASARVDLYPTVASRVEAAGALNSSQALVALYGRIYDPTSLGALGAGQARRVRRRHGGDAGHRRRDPPHPGRRGVRAAPSCSVPPSSGVWRRSPPRSSSRSAPTSCWPCSPRSGCPPRGCRSPDRSRSASPGPAPGSPSRPIAASRRSSPRAPGPRSGLCRGGRSEPSTRCAPWATPRTASGPRWLVWLSPIGWAQQFRPYAGNRWWVLLITARVRGRGRRCRRSRSPPGATSAPGCCRIDPARRSAAPIAADADGAGVAACSGAPSSDGP